MKIVRRSSLDIISELPHNIIEIILMFLPLRDAARTSILSRKWRYQWTKMSKLVFDGDTFSKKLLTNPEAILMKIIGILLLHEGPVYKFTLSICNLKSCSEIDKVIRFLSRNGIQELSLMLEGDFHKVSSYISSCVQLTHLSLSSCVFKLPCRFGGFNKLISLDLRQVNLSGITFISRVPLLERLTLENTSIVCSLNIDAFNLKYFCLRGNVMGFSINSPLLAVLSLTSGDEWLNHIISIAKFVYHSSILENLQMDYIYLKMLAENLGFSILKLESEPNLPKKLPTYYLRNLELSNINFTDMGEISSTLCLIRSSPNLQKLKVEIRIVPNTNVEPVLEYLRMQDLSDVSLDKLREVQVHYVSGLRPELEFIKFMLARSPVLETMSIKPATRSVDQIDNKMLMELARFRRASQKVEIIFSGLGGDQALISSI